MSLKAGPHTFIDVEYDADGDVLYARTEDAPSDPEGWLTPEGLHTWALDPAGKIVGFDLISPRRILEREGEVRLTLPDGQSVTIEGLEAALALPA